MGGENDAGKAQNEVPAAEDVKRDVFVLNDDAEDGEGIGEPKRVEEDQKERENVDESARSLPLPLPVPDGNEKKVGKDEVALLKPSIDEKEKENSEEIEKIATASMPVTGGNDEKEIEKGVSSLPNEIEGEKGGDGVGARALPPSDGNEKENSAVDDPMAVSDGNDGGKRERSLSPSDAGVQENSKEMDAKGEESSSAGSKENVFPHDLKEHEKAALVELRSKLEYAILKNKLYKKGKDKDKDEKKAESQKENSSEEKQEPEKVEEEKGKQGKDEDGGDNVEKGKSKEEEEEQKTDGEEMVQIEIEVDKDIALWGVPLLPSKGDKSTDVLLLKFLIAREFKTNDAFEMLRNTLQWRKEQKIDSILDEDFGNDYDSVGYMKGLDREGHPVCYNVFGVFADDEMCDKTFGTEASRERFLRWRLQLLEKEIQKLDFRPGGVSTLVQINDLKECPGPARKDLRLVCKQAVAILQDNYPEFVARNIFINVPFWYYAFNAILSPFLTQRAKSKFVFSRPSRVTDTLIKYIRPEAIPIGYGGLQRENDPEFSAQDAVFDAGSILMWDLTIIGWDVSYKEEFVPTDEESYTVIVKKGRKISWQDEPIRNSYKNNEPGKVVITIENGMFKKKKVLYRYKNKNPSTSSGT
ncbi:Patellin-4 [Sesamum alatum]|uniref:Patellin-4 n=1 Tax=Sesamum alatum TaxID=300844 RepID=A0AAE2CUL1_9LAMI|nr:Patellin-4 [Sesamum alatum]